MEGEGMSSTPRNCDRFESEEQAWEYWVAHIATSDDSKARNKAFNEWLLSECPEAPEQTEDTVEIVLCQKASFNSLIRLRDAIENLEAEQEADGSDDFDYAVHVLREKAWSIVCALAGKAAKYTDEEYRTLYEQHEDRRRKTNKREEA